MGADTLSGVDGDDTVNLGAQSLTLKDWYAATASQGFLSLQVITEAMTG